MKLFSFLVPVLVALAAPNVAVYAASGPELIECRLGQPGSLSVTPSDAVAVFFPNGIQLWKGNPPQVFDPSLELLGGWLTDVQMSGDQIVLMNKNALNWPFITLSHDQPSFGADYAAAQDFVGNQGEQNTRFGFCIMVRGQQAADRRDKISALGSDFGVKK